MSDYWLMWDCSDCGHVGIPCSPRHRTCPECAHARTFEEFDGAYLPGDDESWASHGHEERAWTQEDTARFADVGASWFCTNCTGDNYGDETECHHCAAPRGASDEQLREALDYRTFQAYMDGEQGVAADLVEQFGAFAGMRAAHGLSFDADAKHEDQLEAANKGRSAFKEEMQSQGHVARPKWSDEDLPSSVISENAFLEEEEPVKKASEDTSGMPSEDSPPKVPKLARLSSMSPKQKGGGAAISVLGLVLGTTVWGFQTHEVTGEVESLHWERVIQEQRWTPVVDEDWQMSLSERREVKPVNGSGARAGVRVQSCRMKHHHYQDYVCGTKQVSCTHMRTETESYSCTKKVSRQESYSCSKSESYQCGETCSTSRTSKGSASRSCSPRYCSRSVSSTCSRTVYDSVPDTCTRSKQVAIHSSDTVDKICERSIPQQWCSYATQRWIDSDRHNSAGTKRPARWPKGSLGPLERERRTARYELTLGFQEGDTPYSQTLTVDYGEFQRYTVGAPVRFLVTNFGTVQEILGPVE